MARSCPWLRSPVRHLLNIWLRNSTKLSNILGKYYLVAVSYFDLSLFSFFSVDGWVYCGIAWRGSPSFTFNVTIMKDSDTGNVWYHFVSCDITRNKTFLGVLLSVLSPEKIYWSWTSSLKLWIMRRLSRRRPMKLRGFSVRFLAIFRLIVTEKKKCDWPRCRRSQWAPPHPVCWCFEVSSLNSWTHFHNLMLLQGQPGLVWWQVGAGWTLLTILLRLRWEILNLKWQHGELSHAPLFNYCTSPYLLISLSLSIGDIGGQMGLFIGASVLTILEIFDYLYEVKWCFNQFKCNSLNMHLFLY